MSEYFAVIVIFIVFPLAVIALGRYLWKLFSGPGKVGSRSSKLVVPVGYGPPTNSNLNAETKSQLIRNLEILQKALITKRHVFRGEIFLSCIGDETAIEKNIYKLCAHSGISGISVGLTFKPLQQNTGWATPGHGSNAAGHVFRFKDGRYSIWVNPAFIEMPEVVGAILAHEVAHIFAMENGIVFKARSNSVKDLLASEQMTDLLSIALGMGKQTLQGCAYAQFPGIDDESRLARGTVGYLKPDMLEFAYEQWKKTESDRTRSA